MMERSSGCAVLAAALLLSGCTGVISTKPWFTAANAGAAPRLRDGVWGYGPMPRTQPCPTLDETKPVKDWPDCAKGIVITGGRLSMTDDKGKTESAPFVVAAGDPEILQMQNTPEPQYLYAWIRTDKTDAAGRAIAISGWRVLCGAPGPNDTTPTRYPGLAKSDSDCTAASIAALRAAAKSSEADDKTDRFEAHWVRAGNR
ncbi:MAG TPA: hypothetical protein VGL58_18975 [Caulobacteraceae bacterium]|jgi:hypothetical protein